jgi:hypothetical protein
MSKPFEKFEVDMYLGLPGKFEVDVSPAAKIASTERERQRAFIESAIREKLERSETNTAASSEKAK